MPDVTKDDIYLPIRCSKCSGELIIIPAHGLFVQHEDSELEADHRPTSLTGPAPTPIPTETELKEASNFYNGVPSEERKQRDIAFLLTTNIPYEYRAALERLNLDRQLVKTNRPSRLAMDHSYTSGRVVGFEQAVKGLFGYFFERSATEVLEAAVAKINEQRDSRTGTTT